MNESPSPSAVSWETTACPLCGKVRSQPIFTASDLLYGCPGEFTLARCDGCGHVFLNPRPTRECIGQFYPVDYGPFRNQCGTTLRVVNRDPERRATIWRWLKRLVLWWIDSRAAPIPKSQTSNLKFQLVSGTALAAGRSPPLTASANPLNSEAQISDSKSQISQRALELGCSHGAFLDQLRADGWECVGVEPAADVANRATERGLDVYVGSLEDAANAHSQTFTPGSFDAVFAWMVIEHLHDPAATLRLARELLKPGGRLLFSVPNFGCWERRAFGRFWYALQMPTHLQHFTSASVNRLLESSGFELVELIHQRNINNLVGTLGLWLRTRYPHWSLGTRLIRWIDNPSALGLCLLAPLARCLALLRQAGRLTIVAKRIN